MSQVCSLYFKENFHLLYPVWCNTNVRTLFCSVQEKSYNLQATCQCIKISVDTVRYRVRRGPLKADTDTIRCMRGSLKADTERYRVRRGPLKADTVKV